MKIKSGFAYVTLLTDRQTGTQLPGETYVLHRGINSNNVFITIAVCRFSVYVFERALLCVFFPYCTLCHIIVT